MSALEDTLYMQIRAAGLPIPERQVRVIPGRRFAYDFAWSDKSRLVLDVQGGQWIGGKHNRPLGYEKDCEKHNLATLAGYRVLTVTGDMVEDGRALALIERALRE